MSIPEIKHINGNYVGMMPNGKTCQSYDRRYVERILQKAYEKAGYTQEEMGMGSSPTEPAPQRFDINERFQMVEQVVEMVVDGDTASAALCGEGGLGKTYTVESVLYRMQQVDITTLDATNPLLDRNEDEEDGEEGEENLGDLAPRKDPLLTNPKHGFRVIKGFSTAKSLYRALYENNGMTIVFDDCDSIQKDPVALNILKGALDSYSRRTISWMSERFIDDGLPKYFDFKGKVIFISNMPVEKLDLALRSRTMVIDLSMTLKEKIDRMRYISKSPDFLPDYDGEVKADAMELINELKDEAKELSLRTLIKVCKVRYKFRNGNWRQLGTYLLTQ